MSPPPDELLREVGSSAATTSGRARHSVQLQWPSECSTAGFERAVRRLAQCSSVTGPGLYREVVRALVDALHTRWAFLGEIHPETPDLVRTVAAVADGILQENVTYNLEGTPCKHVLEEHSTRYYDGDLKRRFPDDHLLHEMGAECYLGTPLRGSDGSVIGVLNVLHDGPIDQSLQPNALLELFAGRAAGALELERNLQALKRSEGSLADFFDNAAVGLHWVNGEGIIGRANRAEIEMMGYVGHEDEYIGRHIADFHADRCNIDEILDRLARGETLKDHPARLVRRDGTIRHVLITSNVLFENGQFVHTRCFTRDVTEQREAEEALRRSEEFNRRLIDSSSDCIKVLDLEGRLLSMSEGGQRRMAIEEITPHLNQQWIDWWKDRRSAAERAVATARAGGTGEFVGFCPAADGTPRWWEVIVTPILGADEKPERLLAVSRDITERRRAEEQLRESERRLSTLMSNLPGMAYRCPTQSPWPLTFVSQGVEDLTGYSPADFMEGRVSWLDVMHADDVESVGNEIARAIEERRVFALVYRIHHRSGEERWVFDRGQPIYDEQGGSIAFEGFVGDLTQQMRAEAALRASEERYRALVEMLPAGVYLCNADGTIAACNRRAVELWGREPKVGDSDHRFCGALRLYLPDGRPLPHEKTPMAQCLVDGEPKRDLEIIIERPNGERLTVLVNIAPLRDGQGNVIGAINCFQDITQRKRTEVALRRREEEFRALAEHTPDIISRFDRDLRHLYLNPAIEAATGIKPEAFLGKTKREVGMPSEHCDRWDRACREVFETGELREVEFSFSDPATGELRSYAARIVPEFGPSGEVHTVLAVSRDITARKRSEEQLREAERHLRQLADTMPQIVWSCRADGSVEYMNQRWYEYTGIEAGRLDDEAWIGVVHPDDRQRVADCVRRSNETGEPFEEEFRLYHRPSGDYRWQLTRRVPMFDAQGRVTRWFGATTDLHDHKRAQEERERLIAELQLERSRLRDIFEKTTSFMFVFRGPDHVFEFANQAYFQLVSRDESILGKPLSEVFPEVEHQGYRELLDRVYATGERVSGHESPVRIKDGEGERTLFVDFVFEPLRDVDGRVMGVLVQGVDLTAQVKARWKIEEFAKRAERSRSDLEAVIATMHEGLITCDADGHNLFMNEAARRIHGYRPEQFSPQALDQYPDTFEVRTLDGTLVPMEQWPVARALRGESFHAEELVIHRTDTSATFIGRYGGTAIRGEDGAVIRAVVTVSDTTAERRAAEQLRASEERFRLATSAFTGLVYEYDIQSGVVARSGGLKQILGFAPEEVDHTEGWWVGRIHPEDVEQTTSVVQNAIKGSADSYSMEYRVRHRDGHDVFLWDNAIIVRSEEGKAQRIIGCTIDVTERKRGEEARARLATIVEASEDAIVSKTLDGIVTSWNRGAERMFGYSADEIIGQPISTIVPPERKDEEARILSRVSQGKPVKAYETIRINKDGQPIDVWLTVAPVSDARGRIIGASKIARNITKRKQAEEALRESEGRLQFALSAGRMGAWEWNIESGEVKWSPGLFAIHGLKPEQFGGRFEDFLRDILPEDRDRVFNAIQMALGSGSEYHIEYRLNSLCSNDRSGTPTLERWVEARGRVFRDAAGKPVRMAGVCMDVTERKRDAEELARHRDHLEQLVIERTTELERSYEQLRQSERMASLGTLSAGLGHDMGNLLLPLRLRIDAIDRKAADLSIRSQLSDDLDAIRRCAEYMQRLTRGLRLFALDPDDERSLRETTDVHEWWQEVEPFFKNALPKHVELERELPASRLRLRIPRHLLTQAMFNLVQNAGDALRDVPRASESSVDGKCERTEPPRVTIGIEANGSGIARLCISDNGPGMTPDVAARCMEPFYTTKPRGLSTGLGLALVHGIVQRVGGRIRVESQPGQGASFLLTLATCEETVKANKPRPVNGVAGPRQLVRGRAVLSVHDPRLRAFAASVLRSLAFDVEEVGQGQAERSSALSMDLWVTDQPQQDGPCGAGIQDRTQGARVVRLDPAAGRPGCWRSLRQAVEQVLHERRILHDERREEPYEKTKGSEDGVK